jgi:cytochrome P450
MVTVVDFDHANPEVSGALFEIGARFRAEAQPVYSTAHGGFWIASRHADLMAILRDTDNFICGKRITLPPQNSPVPVVPLEADEPDHSFYRSVFQPLVLPGAVRRFEDRIRQIAAEALDAIVARGEGDAIADFAAQIPARAMAMIFGFSDEDAYRFEAGFSALVAAAGSGDVARQMQAVESFKAFLQEKMDRAYENPGENDLPSLIARHEVDGRRYTPDECLGLMWSAAGGAIDTTKHAIGHAVRELHRNPAIRQRVIADPSLIPEFVDESLRFNASAFMDSRYVAHDVALRGAQMKAGDRVLLVYGWANRDAEAFADADQMVLGRKPNRHLTFGLGIHQCLGNHLARLEIAVAVQELLRRMPEYELADPAAGPVLAGGMMWGHLALPVRVRATAPTA